MARKQHAQTPLRLKIEPLVSVAESLAERVKAELPTHDGLAAASGGVAAAARQAERVSRSMKSPLSPHRLPAVFLAAALACLAVWIYWRFFYVATPTLALPDRDASELRERVASGRRVELRLVEVPGSHEAIERVSAGEVDLAFVQGGQEIPAELPRLESASPEAVLWLTRDGVSGPGHVKKILTSVAGEGSHSVAKRLIEAWQMGGKIEFLHDWKRLTSEADYQVPGDVDAVFVVKDPADQKTVTGVNKLMAADFHLRPLDVGARASKLDFLKPRTLPRGYLQTDPAVPEEPLATYSVATYIVARRNLTPRLLAQAAHVLDARPVTITERGFAPTTADASEIFQGIEAFMGIIVNIGLAFLALLGLDVMMYRKQFHELNSLISLLSMLQSNKDVLGLADGGKKAENLLYLSLVSDLLGVISMIASYYTQENSTLLFNNLSEVIHQRCDGLKINIQLKILHASVELPQGAAQLQ
ncbi:MAG: hypothetical protein JF612_03370 [Planctomycetia bacterium]|nr:hypothetical protein [Planctomycetia bacterium]